MATSGSVSTSGYEGRYLTVSWERTSYSEANNTSTISWTLKGAGTGQAGYYISGNFKVVIDGTTVFSQATRINLYNGTTVGSGTYTLKHNADGSKNFTISAEAGIYTVAVNCSGSKSFTMDSIARGATLLTAANVTSGMSQVYTTYSNPLGDKVQSLEICISSDGTTDDLAKYRTITKTNSSYTFVLTTTEKNALMAATPGTSRQITFILRTRYNNTYYTSALVRTFSVTDTGVTINATVIDTNTTTTNLTGDSGKLVRYYSTAQVTVSSSTQSGATIKSTEVTNGSVTDSTSPYTFSNVDNNVFTVKAVDSRGLTSSVTVTPPMIDYIKLSCNYEVTMNASGTATLTISGNFYNASFGKTTNTLTVQYQYYKQVSGASSGSSTWRTATVTKNGNTFSGTVNISGLDYKSVYAFKVRATDKLMTVTAATQKASSFPVFDWSDEDFNFNVPVTMQEEVSCLGGWTTPTLSSSQLEYGTWMPKCNQITPSQAYGIYLKMGDVCIINWCLYGAVSYNHPYLQITGLPFNADSNYKWQAGGGNVTNVNMPANTHFSGFGIEVVDGVTTIYGRCLTHGSTEAIQTSQYIGLKSGQTTYCAGTICYRIAT